MGSGDLANGSGFNSVFTTIYLNPPNGFRESYQTASLLSQASKNRVDATIHGGNFLEFRHVLGCDMFTFAVAPVIRSQKDER